MGCSARRRECFHRGLTLTNFVENDLNVLRCVARRTWQSAKWVRRQRAFSTRMASIGITVREVEQIVPHVARWTPLHRAGSAGHERVRGLVAPVRKLKEFLRVALDRDADLVARNRVLEKQERRD